MNPRYNQLSSKVDQSIKNIERLGGSSIAKSPELTQVYLELKSMQEQLKGNISPNDLKMFQKVMESYQKDVDKYDLDGAQKSVFKFVLKEVIKDINQTFAPARPSTEAPELPADDRPRPGGRR
jgi:hypothetical protein